MDTPSYYETSNKPPVPWKLIVIIGGSVILIAAIIFAVVWITKSKNQSAQNQAAVLVEQQLNQTLANCDTEKNPEACRASIIEAVAQENVAAELCLSLEEEAKISCVWKVARENYNSDTCDLIEEKSVKQECANSVYQALAFRDSDISWCEKISGDITRERCVNTMSEEIAKNKGCSGTGIDQSVCDRQNNLSAAITSEDPDVCMTLAENDDQIVCLDTVGSGDRDHDSLSADLEIKLGSSDTSLDSDSDGLSDTDEYNLYKTNPGKADTDDDGYNDKQELEDGYNPLGSGKLIN